MDGFLVVSWGPPRGAQAKEPRADQDHPGMPSVAYMSRSTAQPEPIVTHKAIVLHLCMQLALIFYR